MFFTQQIYFAYVTERIDVNIVVEIAGKQGKRKKSLEILRNPLEIIDISYEAALFCIKISLHDILLMEIMLEETNLENCTCGLFFLLATSNHFSFTMYLFLYLAHIHKTNFYLIF